MTNLQILSHNILYAHIGFDQFGVPVMQSSVLSAGNSLGAFESFLKRFALLHTGEVYDAHSVNWLLGNFAAEFHTMRSVLADLAYSKREFSPQSFAEGILRPNDWIGRSYHRLVNLTRGGCSPHTTIRDSILLVAATEAIAVRNSIIAAAEGAKDLVLMDLAAFNVLSGGEECV